MMKKYLLNIGGCVLFSTLATGAAIAQDTTQKTTTTTTTVREAVQNPDGTYSIIEYPVGKEVVVTLTPTTVIPGASGTARVMRTGNETTINLDLTGLTGDQTAYNVYAVDPSGQVTMLGPVTVNNGAGTLSLRTPMDKFMLVLSPEANLSSYDANTAVVLRSGVPAGQAVIPVATNPGNKQVATAAQTSTYNVPMLGVSNYKGDSEIRVKFTGDLQGLKGKAYINPRKDGVTQVKMRFDDMKMAPKGDRRIVLWAVSPDNKIIKLGQVINSGQRQEAEIRSETKWADFGLFVTIENTDVEQPSGVIMTTFGS